MHLGAANWNDTVLTCSFLSPALEYRVLTLGLENAVVVEGWRRHLSVHPLSRPPEKQGPGSEGRVHGASGEAPGPKLRHCLAGVGVRSAVGLGWWVVSWGGGPGTLSKRDLSEV